MGRIHQYTGKRFFWHHVCDRRAERHTNQQVIEPKGMEYIFNLLFYAEQVVFRTYSPKKLRKFLICQKSI